MRTGLVDVIPERALKMCTWEELEVLVCGDPHIDVAVMKANTTYHGYSVSKLVHACARVITSMHCNCCRQGRSRVCRCCLSVNNPPAPVPSYRVSSIGCMSSVWECYNVCVVLVCAGIGSRMQVVLAGHGVVHGRSKVTVCTVCLGQVRLHDCNFYLKNLTDVPPSAPSY